MATLKYFAQKTKDGYPIPSTMMGFKTAPTADTLVEILPQDYTALPGQSVSAPDSGLRYFVRRKANGQIIPNSLITSLKKPKGLVYEFKKIVGTPTPSESLSFNLTFDNITSADLLVGDSSNVSDWNTFFDLPTLGTPFTSVQVVGNNVFLYGGANIKVKPTLMWNNYYPSYYLLAIDDQAGCITSVGGDAFSSCLALISVNLPECTIVYGRDDSPADDYGGFGYCDNLTTISIPKLTTIGRFGIADCSSLSSLPFPNLTSVAEEGLRSNSATVLDFPLLTTIGNYAFRLCTSVQTISIPSCTALGTTVGNNEVFNSITGKTITLTVPAALMTNNSGNPDGDIQYLQANNTVTVTTV